VKYRIVICLVSVLYAVFLLTGCTLSTDPAAPDAAASIVFGETIAGITLGDSEAQVVRKLGRPSKVVQTDWPGVFYRYSDGLHAGLQVAIAAGSNPGVASILIRPPYDGSTADGVTLGISRGDILATTDPPTRAYVLTDGHADIWQLHGRRMVAVYHEDALASLLMIRGNI